MFHCKLLFFFFCLWGWIISIINLMTFEVKRKKCDYLFHKVNMSKVQNNKVVFCSVVGMVWTKFCEFASNEEISSSSQRLLLSALLVWKGIIIMIIYFKAYMVALNSLFESQIGFANTTQILLNGTRPHFYEGKILLVYKNGLSSITIIIWCLASGQNDKWEMLTTAYGWSCIERAL